MAKTNVAIFGGGMAGLAAAHEPIDRGFAVDVYESESRAGGKPASQPDNALPAPTNGRKALRGEHGFRFFPGFYHNVIATLSEIPRPGGGMVAGDRGSSTKAAMVWDGNFYPFDRQVGAPPWDVLERVRAIVGGLGFTSVDLARMAWFRLKYLTSGPSRRLSYDDIAWKDFIELDSPHYSDGFRDFERSIPRTMSAMAAESTSAMIVGNIGMQFGLGYARPGNKEDRLLAGPTDYRWIEPWVAYLKGLGVTFHPNAPVDQLHCSPGPPPRITHATVNVSNVPTQVNADYYIAAVPLKEAQDLIAKEPALSAADPELAAVPTIDLGTSTSWMAGIQFFLKNDVPMVDGHVFYPKSAWALTSVSQAQFWKPDGVPMDQVYGDGTVRGVISAIISDWSTPSPVTKMAARDYKDTEIAAFKKEVRRQLREGLPAGFDLSPANAPAAWVHHDDRITLATSTTKSENDSPLLIHPKGGYAKRPHASGAVENLFLAADYVRTNTGLATMEGANEAARRAVNALLDRTGGLHVKCPVWDLQEDPFFAPAREMDEIRFARQQDHVMDSCPIRFLKDTGLIDVAQELFKVPAAILLPG